MASNAQALKHPRPAWFKPFARWGYASRGLVYVVVGFFALVTAIRGGENRGAKEAIQFLSENMAGDILMLILLVGLASYAAWRFVQSVFDTDDHGGKPTGLGVRAGLLASGVTYAALAVYAFSLWWGSGAFGSGGGGGSGSGEVAKALARWVGAQYAAYAIGIVLLVVGGAHIWKAVKRKYRDNLAADRTTMRAIDPVAVAGLVARGIIFLILALLFYRRGLTADESNSTPGMQAALDYILSLPAGNILLGATGVGLLAFAAYSFAEAIWRRINVESAV